jgi:transcriptional regulator with XRE-family HTH domain
MDYTIGEVIYAIRKHKGLTQEELAEKIGTTREYISSLENDRANEDAMILYNIGKALKCTLIMTYAIGLQALPIRSMAG